MPTVRLLLLTSTLRFLAGFGRRLDSAYREAFLERSAPSCLIKAAVNGVAGSLSATGGGVLSDRLGTGPSPLGACGWLGACHPVLDATLNAPTSSFRSAPFPQYLLAEWFGPTVAGLQDAAPPRAQGLTTGIFSALTRGQPAPFFIGLAIKGDNADLAAFSPIRCALRSLGDCVCRRHQTTPSDRRKIGARALGSANATSISTTCPRSHRAGHGSSVDASPR